MWRVPLVENQGITRVIRSGETGPETDRVRVHIPLLSHTEGRSIYVMVNRSDLENSSIPLGPNDDPSFLAHLHLPEGDVDCAVLSDFSTEHPTFYKQASQEV